MKNNYKIIFLLVIFLLLPNFVLGAPVISGTSGSLNHGQSLTIIGNGFLNQSVSEIIWDDFEDGVVDTTATVGTWRSTLTLENSNESRNSLGQHSASSNFIYGDQYAGVGALNTRLSTKWFVQHWVKLTDFDWGTATYLSQPRHLSNVKMTRFWNPGSETENIYSSFAWSLTGNAVINIENISGAPSGTPFNSGTLSKNSISDGNWHLIQTEFHDSSVASASDAVYKVWFDGELVQNLTNFVARTNDNLKRPNFVGFYNAWSPNSSLGEADRGPNNFYMDDVYVSPSVARIEIGNASTYDNCTHREIQIPSVWSDSSITFNANQGSFNNDDTAYLYVVDENGEVNTSGYSVTIGSGSADTTAPSSPSELSVM